MRMWAGLAAAHQQNVVGEPVVLAVGETAACQRQPEVGLVDPEVASVVTLVQALGLLQVELLEDPSAHAMSASSLEVGVLLAAARFVLTTPVGPMEACLALIYRYPAHPSLVPLVLQSCHMAQNEEEQKEEEKLLCQQYHRRLHRWGLQQLPTPRAASSHLRWHAAFGP